MTHEPEINAYHDWLEGEVTPLEALRALCSDMGKAQDERARIDALLDERIRKSRYQIGRILLHVLPYHSVSIPGFGTVWLDHLHDLRVERERE